MSLQRQTQICNRNTTCRYTFQSWMKKKGKEVRSEIQLTLTAMLAWMARLWAMPATKIWPWNNFHICPECSDSCCRYTAWSDVRLDYGSTNFPLPSLRAPGWFPCAARVAISTVNTAGLPTQRLLLVMKAKAWCNSSDHHRLVGPAAQKRTPLTTQSPRQDIFVPYLV